MDDQRPKVQADPDLSALLDDGCEREAAWAGLWRKHGHACFRVAMRIVRAESDAWVVVNQAWLEAAEAVGPSVRSFGAWVTTITRKRAIDFCRQGRRRAEREVALEAWHHSGLQTSSDPEARAAVGEALSLIAGSNVLSAAERRAFLLRVLSNLSYDEIARATGTPVNSVSVYIHRARKKLADLPRVQALLVMLLAGWMTSTVIGILSGGGIVL